MRIASLFLGAALAAFFVAPAQAAFEIDDIVCETTTTTGSGTLTLRGAKSGGYVAFADAVTSGSTVPYTITTGTGTSRQLETGVGTFTAPSTLTRTVERSTLGAGTALELSTTSTVCLSTSASVWNDGVFSPSFDDVLVADDILMSSTGAFNFASGNVVVTHSSGVLTVNPGDLRVTTAGTNTASVLTVDGTQTTSNKSVIATDSVTARTLEDREAERVNVKDWGAVGDCVVATGGTDDTAAIQAATDYVVDNGGTLYFPPANYCVTTLDWTGKAAAADSFTSKTVIAYGASVIGTDDGAEAIIDMMGAEKVRLLGMLVQTQTGVSYRNGIQLGRLFNSGNSHAFDSVRIIGDFSLAALFVGPSDFPQFRGILLDNTSSSTTSYALAMGLLNTHVVYSQYAGHADSGGQHNTNARLIENITQDNPAVMQLASGHDIDANELLRIRDVAGMTEINSTLKTEPGDDSTVYCAFSVSPTTVTLYEKDCATPLNTTVGYSAYTSGGLVGIYADTATSNAVFLGGLIEHIDGPAAFFDGMYSATFDNVYFHSADTTAGAAAIIFYGDHGESSGRFRDLTFNITVESSAPDHAYKFMGETTFMAINNFKGRDHSVNVGSVQFAAVDGMNIQLPNFDYHFGAIPSTESMFGPVTGGSTGIFSVAGAIAATGTYGLSSSNVIGPPDNFVGTFTVVDANDPAFEVGSQIIFSTLMAESAIDYIPIKGETCWFGTAAGSYAVETLELQDDICIDGESIRPGTNDDADIGETALRWSDAYFADGAVIDMGTASSRATIAHVAASDSLVISADPDNATASTVINNQIDGTTETNLSSTALSPGADGGSDLGTTSVGWANLHLNAGSQINWNNSDLFITGVDANTLTFNGGTGYVFGHTAALTLFGTVTREQVLGTTAAESSTANVRFSADASSANNIMAKSRGASIGTWTIVQDGDLLGQYLYGGADGTDLATAASIGVYVDGTPGDNVMPGEIRFSLSPAGSSTVAERFRIDSAGHPEWTAATPPTSDCGTDDTFETGSTDVVGRIEVGTTPGSTCTITFATAWTNAPHCSVNNEDSAARAVTIVTTTTTTALITFASAPDAADSLSYHCQGFTG
jgi:hypothetical protein